MTAYALLDKTRQIPVQLGRAALVPDGAVVLPESVDLDRMVHQMLTADGWIDRPRLDAPKQWQDGADAVMQMVALPTGTVLRVTDISAFEVLSEVTITDDPEVTLHLLAGAAYRVDVLPPLPWLPYEIEVAP